MKSYVCMSEVCGLNCFWVKNSAICGFHGLCMKNELVNSQTKPEI